MQKEKKSKFFGKDSQARLFAKMKNSAITMFQQKRKEEDDSLLTQKPTLSKP
ncbi:hypothetical protein BREVNS_0233 [Brevinematales bacterium NS]|jgi:hypothetical protein|nr:hypothetical protein BREVNS_0233 [Brevinematales bacterium NS]